jgi:hypothetical protein
MRKAIPAGRETSSALWKRNIALAYRLHIQDSSLKQAIQSESSRTPLVSMGAKRLPDGVI